MKFIFLKAVIFVVLGLICLIFPQFCWGKSWSLFSNSVENFFARVGGVIFIIIGIIELIKDLISL